MGATDLLIAATCRSVLEPPSLPSPIVELAQLATRNNPLASRRIDNHPVHRALSYMYQSDLVVTGTRNARSPCVRSIAADSQLAIK
jgi:hypothetical protein